MAPDVSGGLRSSPSTGKSKHVLKKGPWTTSEDMILVEYVKKHGEGNWNAVQRNSGLMRCGKSCRLRWANHLRPNLKKGAFTPEEEQLIVDLHAKMGNKWARMAAQLPGRTDNEIKNYWNTRLKRRQRAGLPIYPQQVLQQDQNHHQLNSSSPSPSLVASSRPLNPNPLLYYNTFTSPSSTISPSQNQLKLYQNNNGGLALSLAASNSSFPANQFFNQGLSNPLPMPSSFQYNNFDYGVKSGSDMGFLGLPSIQSPVGSSSDFVMGTTSSDGVEDYEVEPGFAERNKSGLLEDLLGESQALANCPGKSEKAFIGADENIHEKTEAVGFGHANINSNNNYDQGQETKARSEANNAIDDDILNLLDNFPLSVPIPDWDEVNGRESPILSNDTTRAIESQPDVAKYNPVATSTGAANLDWNFGSCLWNNMPSIY